MEVRLPLGRLLLAGAAAVLVERLLRRLLVGASGPSPAVLRLWPYEELRKTLRAGKLRLPAVVVNLDAFDANVHRLAEHARRHGKTLRLASKSLRVPALIRRAQDLAPDVMRGVMCFSAAEARALADQGFDDLLVAYPVVQAADVADAAQVLRAGKRVTLMADCAAHLERLAALVRAERKEGEQWRLPLCIDVDCSLRLFGGALSLGAHRSAVHSAADAGRLARAAAEHSGEIFIDGVMAYEAQVAGLPDAWPGRAMLNPLLRILKRASMRELATRRKAISDAVSVAIGGCPRFFNAGGTGNIAEASAEGLHITEVTCGSGMLQSQLFDYFESNRNLPALAFVLPVTRRRPDGVVVCQSGGFIASGDPCEDKWPAAFLPAGLSRVPGEGFGEVQTPLSGAAAAALEIGDPVFCRPAKAGEVMEHFSSAVLLAADGAGLRIHGSVPTYRGMGFTFH